MAKKLKYLGLSDTRVINKKDFTDNGIDDQGKVEWTQADSVQEVSDKAAEFLAQFSEFKDVTDVDEREAKKMKGNASTDQTVNHDPADEGVTLPGEDVVPGEATGGKSLGGDATTGGTAARTGNQTPAGNGSSTPGTPA